jgi:general secretion pathway protein A
MIKEAEIVLGQPFSTTANPRYFYLAKQYKNALNHAIATIAEKEGLSIIAGPVGSGKSTLMRFLIDWLGDTYANGVHLCYLNNPSYSTDFQLLKAICAEFNIEPKPRRDMQMESLKNFLFEAYQKEETVVILVDEAHRLNGQQFELIREFFNFSHDEHFYVQVILAGEQGPLKSKMKNKYAIFSRAMYYDKIGPLSEQETRELIRYRLRIAEFPEDIFDDAAVSLVHKVSEGIPRTIIKLCRRVLPASNLQEARITSGMIEEILDDTFLSENLI